MSFIKNKYEIKGDVVKVFLSCKGGIIGLFDLSDLPLLQSIAGTLTLKSGYVAYVYTCKAYTQKALLLHRLIVNAPDGLFVDHINGDRLDNRKSNLRLCTNQQNIQNRTAANKNNATGIKNVHWHKTKQEYQVSIGHNGKLKYIGRTRDIEEAKAMAEDARNKYHILPDDRFYKIPTKKQFSDSDLIEHKRISDKSNTGILGVCRTKNGRYQAQIYINNKCIYIGTYKTIEEAEQAITTKQQQLREGS